MADAHHTSSDQLETEVEKFLLYSDGVRSSTLPESCSYESKEEEEECKAEKSSFDQNHGEGAKPFKKQLTSTLLATMISTIVPSSEGLLNSPESEVEFDNFMTEPILCALFRNFLRATYCESNLEFWKRIERYKILDPGDLMKVATKIIEEYLLDVSENELNVSHEHKRQVTQLKPGEFTASSFDLLQLEIYYLIKRDSFRNFLRAPQAAESIAIFKALRCKNDSPIAETHLMSERDMKKVFSGGEILRWPKGTELVTQGSVISCLFRLISGVLSVTRRIGDDTFKLPCIDKPSTLIGEIFLLTSSNGSDVTIVCGEDCEVERVSHSFIHHLMKTDSFLALRFYKKIGRNLANSLALLFSCLEAEPSQRHSISISSNPSINDDHDTDICTSFRVPEDIIISGLEYPCIYYRLIPRKGKMYITGTYILFYAKIFTQKTKERVPITSIIDISHTVRGRDSELKIRTARKKYRFSMQTEHVNQMLPILEDLRAAIPAEQGEVHHVKASHVASLASPDEIPEGQFLSSSDWDIILAGVDGKTKDSSFMTFSDGDVILEEGKFYQMICQITSGTCRIQKQIPKSAMSAVICRASEGEMIGEINFLCGGTATASVVAEGNVDIYVIGPTIREIAETNPELAIRFYEFLCCQIGKRISTRYAEGWGAMEKDEGEEES